MQLKVKLEPLIEAGAISWLKLADIAALAASVAGGVAVSGAVMMTLGRVALIVSPVVKHQL